MNAAAVSIVGVDLFGQTHVPATHFGIERGVPHVEATLEPSKIDVTFFVEHHQHLDGALPSVGAHDHDLVFLGIREQGLDLLQKLRVRILLVDLGLGFGIPSAGQAEQRHVFGEGDPPAVAAFVVGSDVQDLVSQVFHQYACFIWIRNSFFFHRLFHLFDVLDGIGDGRVLAEVSRGGRLRPRGPRSAQAPRTSQVRLDGRCRTGQHRSFRLPRSLPYVPWCRLREVRSREAHTCSTRDPVDQGGGPGPHVPRRKGPPRYTQDWERNVPGDDGCEGTARADGGEDLPAPVRAGGKGDTGSDQKEGFDPIQPVPALLETPRRSRRTIQKHHRRPIKDRSSIAVPAVHRCEVKQRS